MNNPLLISGSIVMGVLGIFFIENCFNKRDNPIDKKTNEKPIVTDLDNNFSGIIIQIEYRGKRYVLRIISENPSVIYQEIIQHPINFIKKYGYEYDYKIISIDIYNNSLKRYQKIIDLLGLPKDNMTESKLLSLIESHLEYRPGGPGYVQSKTHYEAINE